MDSAASGEAADGARGAIHRELPPTRGHSVDLRGGGRIALDDGRCLPCRDGYRVERRKILTARTECDSRPKPTLNVLASIDALANSMLGGRRPDRVHEIP